MKTARGVLASIWLAPVVILALGAAFAVQREFDARAKELNAARLQTSAATAALVRLTRTMAFEVSVAADLAGAESLASTSLYVGGTISTVKLEDYADGKPAGDLLHVVYAPTNERLFDSRITVPYPIGLAPGKIAGSLYPTKSPKYLMVCKVGQAGTFCSFVVLEVLLQRVDETVGGLIDAQLLSANGTVLASHGQWDVRSIATGNEEIDGVTPLYLRTKPADSLVNLSGVRLPLIIFGLAFGASLLCYIALRRQHNMHAAAHPSERVLPETVAAAVAMFETHLDLERSLGQMCEASGITLWHTAPNGVVKTYGPWLELGDTDSGQTTHESLLDGIQSRDSMSRAMALAMSTRQQFSSTFRKEIDGQVFTFHASGVPVYTGSGVYLGLMGTRVDVSAATDAQVMNAQAHASLVNQEHFLRRLYGELTGPVKQTVGALQMLSHEMAMKNETAVQRWLGICRGSSQRIADNVARAMELLQLRMPDAHQVGSFGYPLGIIKEVVAGAKAAADAKLQAVELRGESMRLAFFDSEYLRRVVVELVANALKFSPEGTTVYVLAREMSGRLAISVTDEGFGMSDEDIEQLGTPFFKTDASFGTEGSGLGVAVAKELAAAMRAHISFVRSTEKEVGMIATLTLELEPAN